MDVLPVTIRAATGADVDRLGEIFMQPPSPESLGLLGDADLVRAFARGLIALDRIPNPQKPTVVAARADGGGVVGFLQYTVGSGGMRISLGEVQLAFRLGGPRQILAALPRLRARQRVDMSPPVGTLYVAELHVAAAARGRGVGGALLDWADAEARRLGRDRVSLTTYSSNPARRLYDRHDFAVVDWRTDGAYERYTGIPGRVLMEKVLT
jgi:ribosomal protein S18 acetylase RimI-like enzyme